MNADFCYVPTTLDKMIARLLSDNPQFSSWTPEFIAALRGAYDDNLIKSGYELSKAEGDKYGHSPLWDLDFGDASLLNEKNESDQLLTGRAFQTLLSSEQNKNLLQVATTLVNFRQKVKKKQIENIQATSDNKAQIWEAISKYYGTDLNLFYQRASQLAYYFVQAIDNFIAKYEGKSTFTRQDVINGIPMIDKATGNYIYNEQGKPKMLINADLIIYRVFNQFMQDYSIQMDNPSLSEERKTYLETEYNKIFNPHIWAALLMTSKSILKNLEGLKIDLMDNNAQEIDMSTLNDNSFADLFDPETSVREGWQVMTDCISAYGSLPKEVRRFLASFPVKHNLIHKGVPIEAFEASEHDDLGYPKRLNPLETFNNLKELLRGVRSKSKMIKKLLGHPQFAHIGEELEKNPQLATQVFNSFRHNFQPYIQIKYNAIKDKIYQLLLNKTRAEASIGNYLFGIKVGRTQGIAATSRFNWQDADIKKLKEVFSKFIDNPNTGYTVWTDPNLDTHIANALNLLGIPFSVEAFSNLLSNAKQKAEMVKVLKDFATYAVHDNLEKYTSNFEQWITHRVKKSEKSDNQKKIEKIIIILEECGNGLRIESKCRTVNSKGNNVTYYSDVTPSYLGDFLEEINSFADKSSTLEYRAWLTKRFLKSSQFCDQWDTVHNLPKFEITSNGVEILGISNLWLKNLVMEAYSDVINDKIAQYNEAHKNSTPISQVMPHYDRNSFTANFSFARIVTSERDSIVTPFENFTTKAHYEQLLASFFSFDSTAGGVMKDFVYVPVFVLGDSGVCKILKVKRVGSLESYTSNNMKFDTNLIINELYKLYQSELRRMTLFQKMIADHQSKGIQVNKNIDANQHKFTMLTFLNEAFEGRDFTSISETEVKQAISTYLEKAFNNFKTVGESLGAVSLQKEKSKINTRYDITSIKKAGQTKGTNVAMEERLKEFYYNTYLSNLLQYQMFTGDLGYYANVKDFQKRYKEIHAPGTVLDIEAIDPATKERVCPDGKESVIYINDKLINTEETNPAMMEVIFKVHAKGTKEEIDAAIKEGITKPKQDKKEEENRQKRLKKMLGDSYNIYQKFVVKDSQTDGQGWRSITGVRKLFIMSGHWTPRLEGLYNKIVEINNKCLKENRNISYDELQTIAAFKSDIQPLKPYLFTLEECKVGDDTLFVPVQHKYAEDILIPCLLPVDSKLRKMAEYMEDKSHPIDLICADSCVKVGAWGQTELNDSDDIATILSRGEVHKLNYSDYRIQSNVPEHINVERALGTQVRKLIMGNINMFSSKEYDYLGGKSFIITEGEAPKKLTGRNLVSLYTSLIVANMMQSFSKFKKSIENERELSNILSAAIINNDRYALHQLLDIAVHDGEKGPQFNTPLYEGALEHDTTSLIFSLFRKTVNKQEMKGGAAVQVSDWGITTKDEVSGGDRPLKFVTDETNENILYAEIEIPFKFSYIDSNGNEVFLKFSDYCNEDGTFKMSTKDPSKTLIEEHFPGILDIIAYRIPSERDYSMINCKVVRCTEPTAGGTIRVPAQGTVIAGFDFKQYWSH